MRQSHKAEAFGSCERRVTRRTLFKSNPISLNGENNKEMKMCNTARMAQNGCTGSEMNSVIAFDSPIIQHIN